jgi:signal transduction histidine kinase
MAARAPHHHVSSGSSSERTLLAVGVVLMAVMVAMSLTPAERADTRPYDLFGAVILIIAYGVLCFARRFPLLVLLVVQVATSVWFVRNYAGALPAPALLIGIYALTVRGDRRRTLVGLGIVLAPLTTVALMASDVDSATTTVGIIGWMLAAALLGETMLKRRALEAEYEHRAGQAAAEQHVIMERRLAEERLRIARDLHDVLAHTVTAMSIQSAVAADAVEIDPDRARRALADLRSQARQAVDEVRSSIASLRSSDGADDPAVLPVPSLPALEGLAAEARRSGLDVAITMQGDLTVVPELLEVSAFRIVQEALTNVRRHSVAAEATVHVRVADDSLALVIADPGPCRVPARTEPGFGVVGMRERALAVGGAFDAGESPDGGYQVCVRLPLSAAARR